MRILIFDSGIGGLGVAAEIRALLPAASLIYVADTAGFPYGEKSDASLTAAIIDLMLAVIESLVPDLIVIACNTASTIALDALRARFLTPFVGCVPPVKWAADISRTRTIGLLATPATIRRPYLHDLTARHAAGCTVLAHATPNLARIAETRFSNLPIDTAALHADLAGLLAHPHASQIDVMALGCTHYPRLLPDLRAAFPPHVTWLDPARAVAQQTARLAATLTPASKPQAGDIALFTGPVPTGAVAEAWAAAGFPIHHRFHAARH